MTDTADSNLSPMLRGIKNRKVGYDPMLDELSKATISVAVSIVTNIETFKKTATADSGDEQTVAKYFTERDAYLVTVKHWDAVGDKETCLRTQIIPMLSDNFKLNPKMPVVFQFLDSNGSPMRHVPAPGPKVMAKGD